MKAISEVTVTHASINPKKSLAMANTIVILTSPKNILGCDGSLNWGN